MIKVAMVGLGKMGMSHLAILNAHPSVKVAAVCDSAGYVLDVIAKQTGLKAYTDFSKMLSEEPLDAVVIATPSKLHGTMVRQALERGLHVFCEKPFCLDVDEGTALARLAEQKQLVNQVGYHYRFVGAFQELKRLLDSGAIGRVHHVRAEAYGPVVLRPKGGTWRQAKSEGGGCLYDYACHAIDLMNFVLGAPTAVGGTVLNRVFSNDVEDEVYSTLYFGDGVTGQLAANWSDESHRKMSTKITVWGTNGRLYADRQEVQAYIRDAGDGNSGLAKGWTVKYTTELTDEVWYYLRGEEYSAQMDHFLRSVEERNMATRSTFRSAIEADRVVSLLVADAREGRVTDSAESSPKGPAGPGGKGGASSVIRRWFS